MPSLQSLEREPSPTPTHPPNARPPQGGARVGNQAMGRLLRPPALWTAFQFRFRMGRLLGGSDEVSEIAGAYDAWAARPADLHPRAQIEQLTALRDRLAAYRASKLGKAQSWLRPSQIRALNAALANANTVLAHARRTYAEQVPLGAVGPVVHPIGDLGDRPTIALKPGHQNEPEKVDIGTADAPQPMVWKKELTGERRTDDSRGYLVGIPEKDPDQSGRAAASYRVAQLLGEAGSLAATHRVDKGAEHGQLMTFVQGVSLDSIGGQGAELSAAQQASKETLYWIDLVCGQVDRHSNNIFVERDAQGADTGTLVGIDHDQAFGRYFDVDPESGYSVNTDPKRRQWNGRPGYVNSWGKGARDLDITRSLAERIIRLAGEKRRVRFALRGLISDDEIAATLTRLDHLAAYLTRRITDNDRIT